LATFANYIRHYQSKGRFLAVDDFLRELFNLQDRQHVLQELLSIEAERLVKAKYVVADEFSEFESR
jgi:hypothetical protein